MIFITPSWSDVPSVRAFTTTTEVTDGLFGSFNLADHVGDTQARVLQNRRWLRDVASLPSEPIWLHQIHSANVVMADAPTTYQADGSYTWQPGVVCAVLTADCLPILCTTLTGDWVAAIHAGWRGLAQGILSATLEQAGIQGSDCRAWLGPAISQAYYEVGEEIYTTFIEQDRTHQACFKATSPGKWLMSLTSLATRQLSDLGISFISGGQHCTYREASRFYSYRRQKTTGRMATLIWREA